MMTVAPTPEEVGKLRQGTLLLVTRDGQLVDVTNYYTGIGFNRVFADDSKAIEVLRATAREYQIERTVALQYAAELRQALAALVKRADPDWWETVKANALLKEGTGEG